MSAISLNEEQILSVTLSIRTILMLALSPHAYASGVLLVNVSGSADRHVNNNTGRKVTNVWCILLDAISPPSLS